MADLIDRQAVIDTLHNVLADYIPYLIGRNEEIPMQCAVAIRDLPSVQQWIPCSERLPENEQDVLVTVEVRPIIGRIPYRKVVRAFYTDGKHTDADSAYFWDDFWDDFPDPQYDDKDNLIIPEGWWESSDYYEQQGLIDDFVIAWMSLPESYKGNSNDRH